MTPEILTFNQRVVGSNPTGITIFFLNIIALSVTRKYRATAFVLFNRFVLFKSKNRTPTNPAERERK